MLEAKLAELRECLAAEKDPGQKKLLERSVAKWETIIRKTKGEAEPPRKKPNRKKK